MARMYPRSIQFRRSRAEVTVFSILKRTLPDDYAVLHHVRWLLKDTGRRARDGEADFVIAHPKRGALVLEVKGGEMRYVAEAGVWYSRSKAGQEFQDKDPFDQASEAKHSLQRFLRAQPGWPKGWGPFGHAVCFPDSRLASRPLPHIEPAILIDAADLQPEERLARRIEEVLEWWSDCSARPTDQGFRLLVEALAHDVEIRHPLGVELERVDREIIRLSARQFAVLSGLAENRRVAISGSAGSGKTLLAVEKARRLAKQGLRVLFTCFNRPLADYLRSLPDLQGVDVQGFHQLCLDLSREAGVEVRGDRKDPAFWEQLLPRALERAVDRLGPRYDALIVDEGQDFDESWWLRLLMLLEDPDDGIFYVFYDDNQAIYRRPNLPEGLVRFRLFEDWRNTEPIFEAVRQFYRGESEELVCTGPDGPPIEMREVDEGELRDELSRMLHRLVLEEEVPPADMVVLTPHSVEHSKVRGRVGSFVLTGRPEGRQDIRLESIYRFKGLDAKVVIVCEVDRFVQEDFVKLMYVACSRARTLLIVLLTGRTRMRVPRRASPQDAFPHSHNRPDMEGVRVGGPLRRNRQGDVPSTSNGGARTGRKSPGNPGLDNISVAPYAT